jgi:hypothetical protein
MTTVLQAMARLQRVGGPQSTVVIWSDLSRRSLDPTSVYYGEGVVTVDVCVYDKTRDDLLWALSCVPLMAPVAVWVAGCMRTIGVVEYDELDDTITIRTEMM